MSPGISRRKLLIVEDEVCIRNVLHILLGDLCYQGHTTHYGPVALALIPNESFDTILLDLRCSESVFGQGGSKVKQLCSSLAERVLVIIAEVADSETIEMIERSSTPCISRKYRMARVWDHLRTLFSSSRSRVAAARQAAASSVGRKQPLDVERGGNCLE